MAAIVTITRSDEGDDIFASPFCLQFLFRDETYDDNDTILDDCSSLVELGGMVDIGRVCDG